MISVPGDSIWVGNVSAAKARTSDDFGRDERFGCQCHQRSGSAGPRRGQLRLVLSLIEACAYLLERPVPPRRAAAASWPRTLFRIRTTGSHRRGGSDHHPLCRRHCFSPLTITPRECRALIADREKIQDQSARAGFSLGSDKARPIRNPWEKRIKKYIIILKKL